MSASIRFRFRPEKFVNAVAYLAQNCPGATKLKICKLLYFADKEHLTRFGRPIIGDHYYKLPHGPIPSRGLDILRGRGTPAEKALFEQYISVIGNSVHPKKRPNLKAFSKSDVEVLRSTSNRYGKLTPAKLRSLSHAEAAWRGAEENGAMDYSLFFGDSEEQRRMKQFVEAEQESRDVVEPLAGR